MPEAKGKRNVTVCAAMGEIPRSRKGPRKRGNGKRGTRMHVWETPE